MNCRTRFVVALLVGALAFRSAGAAPVVTFSEPANQTVGVPLDDTITIHFASRLNSATVTSSSVFVTSHLRGILPATVAWNAFARVITITPDDEFIPGERIVVTVTKAVTDQLGFPLPNGWRLEFTTWSAPIVGDFVKSASGWSIGSIALNLTVADLDADRLPEAIFSNVVPDSLTILRPDGAGSFSFWRRVPTPILPRHTVAADVDADGWLDLVCCGSGPNEIAVFRNQGFGSMAPYVAYPTGETPYGAFAGDVDADGDLDIVTANFNGHDVSVLANQGDGTFAAPASYSAGSGADSPRWVDGADLDGDGDVDLVCCNGYSSDVSVFLNDGTGVMTVQPSRIVVQTSPNFLEIRDLDGDALADVVTVNAGPGSISFLKGNGDGTFQSAVHDSVGGTLPYGLQVADIDGDVDLDVAVPIRGITPNAWRIMWNHGDGTFGQGNAYAGGTHCHTVGTADWDFDGDLDVIAGYAISQNMYFYEHAPVPAVESTDPPANATGAPRADAVRLWFSTGLSPESVNPEAFVVSGGQSGPMSFGLAWSPATNELTITPSSPFAPGEIVTVTVTGDGAVQSDEGVPHPGFAFEFLTEGAAASGSFSPSSIPFPGTDPVHMAAADLDEDAVNDLVVANYLSADVTVLLTGGSGLPVFAATLDVGAGPVAVSTSDLDGDGAVDAAVANLIGDSISLLRNAGSGALQPAGTVVTAGSPFALEAADVDRDGDPDLVVAGIDPDGVRVYWNDGSGAFPTSDDAGAAGMPLDVALADVDLDGDLDVLSVDSGNDRVEVLRWDPDVGFSSGGTYATGATPIQVFPWDVTGDGWIDIASADYGSGTLSILENAGNGTFPGPATTLVTGDLPRGIWGADVTGDGRLDLVAANSGGDDLELFRNLGGGSFDEGTSVPVGPTPYCVVGGDWNGDGRVDLASVNRSSGDVAILVNGSATGAGPSLAGVAGTSLLGGHPNPFREDVSIRLDLARAMPVGLRIFDLQGRAVATIHDGPLPSGPHRLRWDGRDGGGLPVAAGVYFVRMEAPDGRWTRKILRMQ